MTSFNPPFPAFYSFAYGVQCPNPEDHPVEEVFVYGYDPAGYFLVSDKDGLFSRVYMSYVRLKKGN